MIALRHACRSLVRSPSFALSAAATFALGIGINAAVFACVDRLLFRPLPYREPERLFLMQLINLDSGQRESFLPAKYVAEAKVQLPIIEDMAILGDSTGYFETPENDGPEVRVSFVTSRMLEVGGVVPVLGRGFVEEDDRLERQVVILTHDGWQTRFGGDPSVLGRRLWYRHNSLEIIGVLPRGYIPSGAFIDPNAAGVALMPSPNVAVDGIRRTLPPTIRLRPGVSREAAQADLDALIERLEPEMPVPTGGRQALQLIPIRDAMFGQYYKYLWLVLGGAALVLLIACANLACLFLVRGRSRLLDAAVRLSLGSSRRRLIGDAMAESLVVCISGTAAALVALHWSSRGLEAMLPPIFSRFSDGVDVRVVIVAIATAVTASLVAAILPALLLGKGEVWRVVQGGSGPLGSGSPRRGRWLLAVEAAVSILLVAGAAVTARNLSGLTSAELGFDPRGLHLVLIRSSAAASVDRYADLQQALAIVRGEPGVSSAGGAPMLSVLRTGLAPFSPNGPPCCRWQITGDYLSTIGISILAGRAITDEDVRARAPVALLNEAGLQRMWPRVAPAQAIGRTFSFDREPTREVVGIVGDTRRGYDDDVLPAIFMPVMDDPFPGMLIVARTRPGSVLMFSALRARIDVSGRRSLLYVRPMAPMYARVLEPPRFRAALFGTFGALALVIAMVGLYAVTSFDVMSRRRELGVRLALGASGAAVLRMVLADTGKPVAAGVAAGLGIAIWAGPFIQSFLYRFNARDPWTLAVSAIALLLTSAAAAWLPAWRASRVDAVVALRTL